jgi:hypothetical protein
LAMTSTCSRNRYGSKRFRDAVRPGLRRGACRRAALRADPLTPISAASRCRSARVSRLIGHVQDGDVRRSVPGACGNRWRHWRKGNLAIHPTFHNRPPS